MQTESRRKAANKYQAKKTRMYTIKLVISRDHDIIHLLDTAPNKQAIIKAALREYIAAHDVPIPGPAPAAHDHEPAEDGPRSIRPEYVLPDTERTFETDVLDHNLDRSLESGIDHGLEQGID